MMMVKISYIYQALETLQIKESINLNIDIEYGNLSLETTLYFHMKSILFLSYVVSHCRFIAFVIV